MKNNYMIICLFGFFIFGLTTGSRHISAQEQQQERSMVSQDIEFKSKEFKKDNLGTRVANIHTFDVDFKNKERVDRQTYIVVLYINERPITQFENVRLPYSFDWNFNAMQAGHYVIKIDIEDLEGNLLATQETSVEVSRREE